MSNKYRLGLYDDKALSRAAMYHVFKRDLDKPIFELDRNEVLMYYRVVFALSRFEHHGFELEGVVDDLVVLEFAGSKVVSKMYKYIYGSIVKICKNFFGKMKR